MDPITITTDCVRIIHGQGNDYEYGPRTRRHCAFLGIEDLLAVAVDGVGNVHDEDVWRRYAARATATLRDVGASRNRAVASLLREEGIWEDDAGATVDDVTRAWAAANGLSLADLYLLAGFGDEMDLEGTPGTCFGARDKVMFTTRMEDDEPPMLIITIPLAADCFWEGDRIHLGAGMIQPETITTALVGRPLRTAFSHPLTDALPLTITSWLDDQIVTNVAETPIFVTE